MPTWAVLLMMLTVVGLFVLLGFVWMALHPPEREAESSLDEAKPTPITDLFGGS